MFGMKNVSKTQKSDRKESLDHLSSKQQNVNMIFHAYFGRIW